ncbi:MAG TPA: LON peptidase substrate-binding domain-containing protein [Burkholderiales bacterium]|nr:LON peptidase substrate-binding domain-containing protein [Burkholderiales bacterium]
MAADSTREIFLFPLNTVLFPEGVLPLKVFELRYIEMTKTCLRDNIPFGVCLIREGPEVGTAALPARVGCLATIAQWEMPQLGLFHLLTRGGQRFRVRETRVAPNQLITAKVELLPLDPTGGEVDTLCGEILKTIIEKVGTEHFPEPLKLDDAAWVSYRLAEVLPIETAEKQELLELQESQARFQRLRQFLARVGLAGKA